MINSRETRVPHSLFLFLFSPAASSHAIYDSRESNAPAGTRRHHANLQVEGKRGTTDPLLVPLFAFQASWIISYLAAVLSVISTSLVLFSEPYESRLFLDAFSRKRNKNAFQKLHYKSYYHIIHIIIITRNIVIIFQKI